MRSRAPNGKCQPIRLATLKVISSDAVEKTLSNDISVGRQVE
jgi:hypothetical protein